jgi:predicted DNA-binding WGR domain protein
MVFHNFSNLIFLYLSLELIGFKMAKTRLEYNDKASQKFWEVSATGNTINIKYGRLGTNGQNSVKKMGTPDAAKKEVEKLIKSKLKKGYKKK